MKVDKRLIFGFAKKQKALPGTRFPEGLLKQLMKSKMNHTIAFEPVRKPYPGGRQQQQQQAIIHGIEAAKAI